MTAPCRLCGATNATGFAEDKQRPYLRCPDCALVFVPDAYLLDAAEEKARYDQHENDPADPRYRQFLSRLAIPLMARLAPASLGLDFGCGPGPALAAMLREAGHDVALYDRFYAPDESVFANQYDFITATEVAEHLRDAGRELDRLWHCLRPGGWLGLMTKMVRAPDAFAAWHYIRDPTHIAFFSPKTFRWLANRWNTQAEFIGDDVVLMQK